MKNRVLITNRLRAVLCLLILVLLIKPLAAQQEDTDIEVGADQDPYPAYSDSIYLRQVSPDIVKTYKENKDFEYANDPAYWKPQQRESSNGFGEWMVSVLTHPATKVVFYLLILSAAIFIIYRLIVVNQLFYRSKPRVTAPMENNALLPDLEEVDSAIHMAIAAFDYRLAIRFLYLRTLYRLNARELIQFDPKITNQEYQRQMKSTPFHNDFTRLVHIYEYSWYGEFVISEEQFSQAQNSFNHFTTRITY